MADKYELQLEGHKAGRPWVAHITGSDPKYGLKREFVKAYHSDYDSKGRLNWSLYKLDDGLYEYEERTSWSNTRRGYFQVLDGKHKGMSGLEVKNLIAALESPKKPGPTNLERIERLKLVNGHRLVHGYKIVKRKGRK